MPRTNRHSIAAYVRLELGRMPLPYSERAQRKEAEKQSRVTNALS